MTASTAESVPVRIVVDIDVRAHPICGELASVGGARHEFTGWIELTRVLERLITDAARDADA
jgi:hypothetical protein